METQHTFSPGQTAHTIWGPRVVGSMKGPNNSPVLFVEILPNFSIYINDNGLDIYEHQILYPHPVRVTPIPEFEPGQEYEFSEYDDFRKGHQTETGRFIGKDSNGYFVFENSYTGAVIRGHQFARKITKPEKTTEELKADLIQLQEMLIVLFEAWFNNREGINEHDLKLLKDKISSLQEQIKQKS